MADYKFDLSAPPASLYQRVPGGPAPMTRSAFVVTLASGLLPLADSAAGRSPIDVTETSSSSSPPSTE